MSNLALYAFPSITTFKRYMPGARKGREISVFSWFLILEYIILPVISYITIDAGFKELKEGSETVNSPFEGLGNTISCLFSWLQVVTDSSTVLPSKLVCNNL